ncbi:fungal-specific transcription factor domain-containing protein [Trametes punicea]|nr:fungal-specific transcription factor domain-containing protein [Trametes punicea]
MNRDMLPNVNAIMYPPTAPAPAPPPPQPQPPSNMIQSPTSIVSASSWHTVASSYYPSTSTAMTISSSMPAQSTYMATTYYNHPHSQLAPSYNVDPNSFSDDEPDQSVGSPDGRSLMPMTVNVNGFGLAIPGDQNRLIHHYLANVLPIQYLLADASIRNFMINLIQSSSNARDAACVLSALHLQCMSYPAQSLDAAAIFNRVETLLLGGRRSNYTEGDAMAGLHIVSSFLFSGGRGSWQVWLDIACQYVQNMLDDQRFYGPEDALKRCSESARFIIKTTMWFDVLASVTTQQVPRFLETYRRLFGGQGAHIGDPATSSPEISMLPVMGCENKIVLAIAEISNLACWKEAQLRRGTLSIPELVRRGAEIEETLLVPSSPQPLAVPLQPGMYGPQAMQHVVSPIYTQPPMGSGVTGLTESEVAARRRLTNDIFRASAKVYLHTVLSGDYPACPDIMAAVKETIDALRRVPMAGQAPTLHRSVVRSVVFGICISGCLTDDRAQRAFLLDMLEAQQKESVGNIGEVKRLMQNVWDRRDAEGREHGYYRPVDWRAVMLEGNRDFLLLV